MRAVQNPGSRPYHPGMQRATRQREAIFEAFAAADRPLAPGEILTHASRRVRGLGMATVYRTIKGALGQRRLVRVDIPGEPPRYELAGKKHHHHFSCTACGKVYEIHDCPGELRFMTPRGFEFHSHELVLFGRCAVCVRTKPAMRRR